MVISLRFCDICKWSGFHIRISISFTWNLMQSYWPSPVGHPFKDCKIILSRKAKILFRVYSLSRSRLRIRWISGSDEGCTTNRGHSVFVLRERTDERTGFYRRSFIQKTTLNLCTGQWASSLFDYIESCWNRWRNINYAPDWYLHNCTKYLPSFLSDPLDAEEGWQSARWISTVTRRSALIGRFERGSAQWRFLLQKRKHVWFISMLNLKCGYDVS